MRKWIVVTALLASGTAFSVDSSTFQMRDTDELVRACSVPAEHPLHANATGFCHGVLVGAYRYYEATVAAGSRFVCPPSPAPSRANVMNDFVAWAKAHPQTMKEAPVDTLFRYLAETYPCRN